MPCGDDMVVSYNNEHSISHVEDSSHNHDSESDDGCTPFCICQCCGTSIDLPLYSLIYSKKKAKNSQHYPNYISNYSFDFKGGVWHPPSIG
jgi:predicted aldo/keto reductase-like oxidoreductase